MRECTTCGVEKPDSKFYFFCQEKCKICYDRHRADVNRPKPRPTTKVCATCKETLPYDDFFGPENRRAMPHCRSCVEAADPNRHSLAYRERRRRAFRLPISAEWWENEISNFNSRCAYCHRPKEHLTKDHVIPLNRGGPHIPDNLVPACKRCNSSKSDRTLLDFLFGVRPD